MVPFKNITFAAKSDVGRVRANNEDAFGAFPGGGVWCVADGMGGGEDGEVASAAVVNAVEDFARNNPSSEQMDFAVRERRMVEEINAVSDRLFRYAQDKRLESCGTTVVALLLDPGNPCVASALHAGDSRLYRIRDDEIRQITTDHSVVAAMHAKESEVSPLFRGMILRAVGVKPSVRLDVTRFDLRPGDRILLCSDGLTRMVPDPGILSILKRHGRASSAVAALLAAANAAGGHDNITAVLVDVRRRGARSKVWIGGIALLASIILGALVLWHLVARRPQGEPGGAALGESGSTESALRDPQTVERNKRWIEAENERLRNEAKATIETLRPSPPTGDRTE